VPNRGLGSRIRLSLHPGENVLSWGRSDSEIALGNYRGGTVRFVSVGDGRSTGHAAVPDGYDWNELDYPGVQPLLGNHAVIGGGGVVDLQNGRLVRLPLRYGVDEHVAWYDIGHYVVSYGSVLKHPGLLLVTVNGQPVGPVVRPTAQRCAA